MLLVRQSAQDEVCQGLLHALDIRPTPELALDRVHVAGDVDLHLGIHIKSAGRLHRKVRDGAIEL